MIVFNLRCEGQHRFEGWFRSAEEFETQQARGLLECPVCGGRDIEKLLSAPRLNLGAEAPREAKGSDEAGRPADGRAPGESGPPGHANDPLAAGQRRMFEAQAEFYRRLAELLERSEDVGSRFPEEARRIHRDEAPARRIHGEASPDDVLELLDEGIGVVPLPIRPKRKHELN